jgi:hypothetical protein
MSDLDLKKLVKEAEAAVAGVENPELKQVAFEKILERLLGGGGARPAGPDLPSEHEPAGSASKKKRVHRGGPQTYIEELLDDGFFDKPQTIAQVKAELANRGHHFALTRLSTPLQRLCTQRKLRRQKGLAAEKGAYGYTKW